MKRIHSKQQNIIEYIIDDLEYIDPKTAIKFRERLRWGDITRDEDILTHICVYNLPYDPKSKEIYIIDHIKADQWLTPGGHIDKGEDPYTTSKREIEEELNTTDHDLLTPFFLSITTINKYEKKCKEHYDIWMLHRIQKQTFKIKKDELRDGRWIGIDEAITSGIVTDPNNIAAFKTLKKYFI